MNAFRKGFGLLALLLVSCLLLSGTAFAKELVVYSSVDEENAKNILDAFSAATGIKVNMIFLSSGPAMSRIEAEKANPQADVWFGAPSENHIVAKGRGLTVPYVPPAAKDLAESFRDKEGYWHAFYMNPLGFGVLAERLKKDGKPVPASWDDLLNPAYERMIQMPSPQSSGTAYAMIMTLIETFGEDKAFEYMKKLNPNIQTYTQSGTGPSKSLAIGETQIAIQFTPAFLKLVDEGYPAEVVFPKEGVGFEAAALSIIKGAKNMDEAKQLVDWIVSKEGQQVLSEKKTYFFPVRTDVPAGKGLPALSEIKLVEYDPVNAAKEKKRIIDRWVTEVLGN
ncbi:ABC transporter substrate-binding protein [Aminivibrio sp.]